MEKMQESINKDLEELKNKHTKANNTITEIKNTLEGFNSRISEAEEWISEPEDKVVEIISEEQNKVKRMKRAEDSLRELWDNIKDTKIRIIGDPEKEEKKKWKDLKMTKKLERQRAQEEQAKRQQEEEAAAQSEERAICCSRSSNYAARGT